jgi:hypothetical protein
MKKHLSKYILELAEGQKLTYRTEDREACDKVLADAAVALAHAVAGSSREDIRNALLRHERLRRQLWLGDAVQAGSTQAWDEVKKRFEPAD